MLTFLLYLGLGLLMDLIVTRYYIAISARRVFPVSILAGVITAFSFWVIGKFVTTGNVWLLAGYCVGNAIGTFIGMKSDLLSFGRKGQRHGKPLTRKGVVCCSGKSSRSSKSCKRTGR